MTLFCSKDLVENGPLKEGTYYNYISRAKNAGYIKTAKQEFGPESIRPIKYYRVEDFREFMEDEHVIRKYQEAIERKFKELEEG